MLSLPNRPDLGHLKRQAKALLAAYRRGAPEAAARFRAALPHAAGPELRLHDAQSCLAREYGFASWADLRAAAEARRAASEGDPAAAFCRLAYGGDIAGGTSRARPEAAARLLADHPDLAATDPWIACAAGDLAAIARAIAADPAWGNRPGGPLALPPLVAVTHSGLLALPDYRPRLHAAADLLLKSGADPNQAVGSRWPPASPAAPSDQDRLSALYGAAGVNHDPDLTRLLLTAGADPNDNESLYHSLEAPACTRLLLQAGAVVAGTNALARALDFDDLETFRLLLSHAAGAEELKGGRLILWAIRRRRSAAHVQALLAAGADPAARTRDGASAHTQALRYGLPEVAQLLQAAGVAADPGEDEAFLAACARGDAEAARRIQARRPDLPGALSEAQLRLLPELAAAGCAEAAGLMADLGWPVAVRGGDWGASALNHAVFRGDPGLARRLLARGASWTEEHGMGDNVCGTLSWASRNRPVAGGDWLACAAALLEHGMPPGERDPGQPDCVVVAGKARPFPDEIAAVLLGGAAGPSG